MRTNPFPVPSPSPGSGLLGLVFLVALNGCATSPSGVRPETGTPVVTRILGPGGGDVLLTSELSKGMFHLDAPPEEVWLALPDAFEGLGIEITYRHPGSMAMGNNNFRARRIGEARNSTYLDCGYGRTAIPHADAYEVTASLVTSLRPGEGGGTVMETLFAASARARDVSGGNISCSSKGTLERRMVEMLTELLGGTVSQG